MSDNSFTIKAYNSLTTDVLECIESLNSCMPEYELYYEDEVQADADVFFAAWDGSRLIGFLSFIYVPGCDEAEITALVAPDMRGRGVFGLLLNEAQRSAAFLNIRHFYYAPVHTSDNTPDTASNPSPAYSHSEYLLKLDCNNHPAGTSDNASGSALYGGLSVPLQEQLAAASLFFHEDEEDESTFCCITDSKDNILSSCFLDDENSYICIWGVETDAHHRRKGLASLLMQCIIAAALAASNDNNMPAPVFMLQVSGRNTAALNLYKKCGFLTESRIDYYSLHS